VRRHRRDVDVAGLLDRLAVVERLQHRQLAGALLDDARDAVEVLRPLAAGELGPHLVVGPAGRLHRRVDVGLVGLGDLGEDLLGGRTDRLERPAVAVDELAVDEQAVGGSQVQDRAGLRRRGVLEHVGHGISPG